MFNRVIRSFVVLSLSVALMFAGSVTLSIDGNNLNYDSETVISGFQFNHDGCVGSVFGGDATANGFSVSASSSTVLGFSFSGSVIPAGSGTLVEFSGPVDFACLSGYVFSGPVDVGSLSVIIDDGDGDIVTPSVIIVSPADGSVFEDVSSIDVTVSGADLGDGDHYHAYLNGDMQGMFYTDSFSIDVGYGDYILTVDVADGSHNTYEGSGSSVSFSNIESVITCDDGSACNTGDEGDCEYAEENYDCDGNCTAGLDCNDECGGSAVVDDCGLCGGDGTSCLESTVDILYSSDVDIYGFQFNTDSGLTGASGGAAEAAGFMVSAGGNGSVIGFSMTGSFVPAGEGVLTTLTYTGEAPCVDDLILSGPAGSSLDATVDGCTSIIYGSPVVLGCTDELACNYDSNATDDDGSCSYPDEFCLDSDGDGLGAGDAISSCDAPEGWVADCSDLDPDCATNDSDECGVCGGDNSSCADCAGVPNGDSVVDECGVCGGGGIAEGACDCAGNVDLGCGCGEAGPSGCDEVCGSTLEFDECGVCGGDGSDDLGCGCFEPGPSGCDEVCGSTLEFDECGVCGGDGIAEGACDCAGNVDLGCGCGEAGPSGCDETCGSTLEFDECGVCDGDGPGHGCWDGVEVCDASECSETPENYPSWSVNPPDYQYNGSVTSIVMIDDILVGNSIDMVAAFVGDECRGIANGLIFPPLGVHQFNVLAYSNESIGEALSFKYYDSTADEVIDLAESIEFISDMTIGNGMNPFIFTPAISEVTTNIGLQAGWNWFSINALSGDMSLTNVLSSINGSSNYIKSQGAYADYYDGFGWWGTLESINNAEMYKLVATAQDAIEFTGSPVDPSSVDISLSAGWNWIGFTPQGSMAIGSALSSIDGLATYIKSQGAYADYYDGFGWWGTLENLNPWDGYMLSMLSGGTLTYPTDGVLAIEEDNTLDEVLVRSDYVWNIKTSDYEYNGSITAEIMDMKAGDQLAVFAGEECRGVAVAIDVPFGDYQVFPLMVYANEEGEVLTFKHYNAITGEVKDIAETYTFISDMAEGDALDAVQLSFKSDKLIAEGFSLMPAYPNPFNPKTTLNYSVDVEGDINISVLDMNGRVVEILYNGFSDIGHNSINWDASNSPSGVYFVKLISGNQSQIQKIVLIK